MAVLFERAASGDAALREGAALVAGGRARLTIVTIAPQDTSKRCCHGDASRDYNDALRLAAEADLRHAREIVGAVVARAHFRALVQRRDPPLVDWIAAEQVDLVLLPARRLARGGHPLARALRAGSPATAVRVIRAPS